MHHRTLTRELLKSGLLALALAVVAVLGGILVGPAAATSQDIGARKGHLPLFPATGSPEPPTQTTQTAQADPTRDRWLDVPTDAQVDLVVAPADGNLKIWLGDSKAYTATAIIRVGPNRAFATNPDTHRWSLDVTGWTRFAITQGGQRSGACKKATCKPAEVGDHTVTGAFPRWPGHIIQGATVLQVERPVERLELDPANAEIQAGANQPYKAIGVDQHGNQVEDLTERTDFKIDPPGKCSKAGAEVSCTSTEPGKYTVTGTLRDTNLSAIATLTVVPRPTTSTTTTTIGPTTSTTTTTIGPTTSTTIGSTNLARLELRPARASIVVGARQAYAVEGFANDGTSLGIFTTATSFSIGPDGACDGASCSATTAGTHIVTGTLTQNGRRISGLAELQVLNRQPAISSVQPGFTFPGMSVEVGGNTGSCKRAGTLTFHGQTGDVSVKVTADHQGNFVARVTIPRGTFPKGLPAGAHRGLQRTAPTGAGRPQRGQPCAGGGRRLRQHYPGHASLDPRHRQ